MFGFILNSHVVIVFAFCFELYGCILYHFNFENFLGQQARDALLLIMQLSNRNEHIARYIVENTNFCPVRILKYLILKKDE